MDRSPLERFLATRPAGRWNPWTQWLAISALSVSTVAGAGIAADLSHRAASTDAWPIAPSIGAAVVACMTVAVEVVVLARVTSTSP